MSSDSEASSAFTSLSAGGVAGLSVDLVMYPLDTIKTRIQSELGFVAAGGLRRIYAGLSTVLIGSVPSGALFFLAYNETKRLARRSGMQAALGDSLTRMSCASIGECVACCVRVPCEVIKQRAQANSQLSTWHHLRVTLANESFRGLFRGYQHTVFRDIPFAAVQYPIWEHLKGWLAQHDSGRQRLWHSILSGAFAGGVAAAITTPLDVVKTRVMLAERSTALSRGSYTLAFRIILRERGLRGLFAGLAPRVAYISIGGCVFLGTFDAARFLLRRFGISTD